MKILNLRFANLNSLQGEWEIDFSHPSYQDSGIFLIYGPTGSGKSTILDAISLALYGQTPRLSNVSKSNNEIMSRGQATCYAELTFTTAAGTYRCHWSQHRARKTVTGELQTPRHEVVDHTSGTILETKIKEVGRKVVAVTGMDFSQFTRAMMLAQGEFNKFLLAGANDRAPLLEQITGTEIYSQISQEVHRLRGEEQHKLDILEIQLGALQLLTEEEENSLKTALAELQQRAAVETEMLAARQQTNNRMQAITRQQETVEHLQAEQLSALSAWQQGAELRQRISQAEEAQRLFPFYLERQRAAQQVVECREKLTAERDALTEVHQQVAILEANHALVQAELTNWQQEQEQAAPLLKKVQALDIQLGELTTQLQEVSQKQSLVQQRLAAKQQKKQQLATRKRQEEEHRQRLQDHQQNRAADEALVSQLAFLEDRLLDLEKRHRQLTELRTLVSSKEQEVGLLIKEQAQQQTSLQQLASQYTQLAAEHHRRQQQGKEGPSLSELYRLKEEMYSRAQLLSRLHDNLSTEEELQATIKQLRLRQQEVHDKSRELELLGDHAEQQLKQYRQSLDDQEEIVRLKRAVAAYEEDRKHLQEGQPCPLCGATTHPFAGQHPATVDQAANILEEKKKLVDSQLTHCHRLALEQGRIAQEANNLDERLSSLLAESLRLQTLTGELAKAVGYRERVTLASITGERQKALEQQTLVAEQLAQREELEARLQQEGAQLAEVAARRTDIMQQVQQHQQQLQLTEAALNREKQHLHALHTEYGEVQTRLTPALKALQADLSLLADPLNLLQQLQKRRAAWLANQAALDESQNSLNRLEQESSELAIDCQNLMERLAELQAETQQQQSKIKLNQEMRQALLGTRDPVQVEAEQSRRGEQIRQLLLQTEKQLVERTNRRAELTGRIASLEDNLTSKAETLRVTTEQLTSLLGASLLPDEDALLASKLEKEELAEASKASLLLTQSKDQAELRLADGRQQLAKMMAEAGDLPDHATLRQEIDSLSQSISQLQNEIGAINSRLTTQEQTRRLQAQQAEEITLQRQELQYWHELHALIGSADGKKFRNYAQGLTFELMIQQANRILIRINDRYLLTRSPLSPLDLYVIDNYQAGESRTVANLSGGESFLVSLALALGLSSMAGKSIRVDSLFLDEGFGTLDEKTLEVAMDALASLQRDGKLVGVISHVPLLRDRLGLQLQVLRKPGGRSVLQGPGVRQILSPPSFPEL